MNKMQICICVIASIFAPISYMVGLIVGSYFGIEQYLSEPVALLSPIIIILVAIILCVTVNGEEKRCEK